MAACLDISGRMAASLDLSCLRASPVIRLECVANKEMTPGMSATCQCGHVGVTSLSLCCVDIVHFSNQCA